MAKPDQAGGSAIEDMLASIRQAIHQETVNQAAGGSQTAQAPARVSSRHDAPVAANDHRANGEGAFADNPVFLRRLADDDDADIGWDNDQPAFSQPVEREPQHKRGSRGIDNSITGRSRVLKGIMGGDVRMEEALSRLGHPTPDKPQPVGIDEPVAGEETTAPPLEGGEPAGSWWPDVDAYASVDDRAEASIPAAPAPATLTPAAAGEGLMSPDAAEAAAGAFARLADELMLRASGGEASVSDIARNLLKPMLRRWLDENLPSLVERLVREEIERVARTGRGLR